MTDQPDTDTTWDRIDEQRRADLDDVGSPGYTAVVAITADGEERLVLAWREGLGRPGERYWPAEDYHLIAPHELVGLLPKPYASTCGRPTSSGKPCKVRVRLWGDTCAHHAEIESEPTDLPVSTKE